MPGVVTKKSVFVHPILLYRLGGAKLIAAVLKAKSGTPFLTVYISIGV